MSINAQHFDQLLEISRDLASTLDLEVLLRKILRVAENLSSAETAYVFLYDENKGGLVLQASTNSQHEHALQGQCLPATSVAGWVCVHRKPMIVVDVESDQRAIVKNDSLLNTATTSLIAVPLVAKDKIQGVLEVVNKKQDYFNEQDVDVLTVLAAQAAIAVENSRLYQQADLINELVHELRTPLASILTIAYLLKRSDLTNDQRQQFAESIAEEVTRLNDLASSYLEYSRLEAGRLTFSATAFDLRNLLTESCRTLRPKAEEAGISIQMFSADQPLFLTADENKIKQVVVNLLNNAIKYNQTGGRVLVNAWKNGDSVSFSIQDNGVGIPEADLPHVFEKFYRAHNIQEAYPGTGLGLSICNRIIEIHGGTITVQSQVNAGSTFTVELPVNVKK
ncbi:histidine kinase [Longilinea arvoryzae]|uniref:histidine kinase n=1 Tax=Longilinea arvoryzae TaxID=360412 RepID=A0A0S7BA80_9CHLR|nr:HAMP domain-containing sensor histidine kinase [Longilinea arvoryzae]GAP14375.1 histidine kinase [Longilinea arvoryzae]